ncbi:MAG: hypothetical protein OXE53_13075 [Deltaproteobacteria bacterium]|nr:hypothetical protein [Deltaproteobacteria bacterium]
MEITRYRDTSPDEARWLTIEGEARIKVFPFSKPSAVVALNILRKKHGKKIGMNSVEQVKRDFEVMARFAAEHLIETWEGFTWNGKAFPFTVDNAIKLFDRLRWAYKDVIEFAQAEHRELAETDEEAAEALGND